VNHELKPDDIDASIDLIRTAIPENQPDWTENIAWSLHDPKTGVSIFAHLGRLQPDRRIWEGLSLIYLPDGTLVNRSLGVSLAQARNGEYHYQPIIPAKLWHYKFDGVAQRVDPQALLHRPLGDEPFEVAAYDLVFDALQPVFNMHHSNRESERMHLEHAGRFQGTVTAAGRRYDIDCTGYRDHSVSRRTFTTLDTETWTNCAFPSGRVFSLLEVRRGERRILEGQVFIDGKMELAKPLDVPDLQDSAGGPHSGTIALESASGRHDIQWEIIDGRFLPFQLMRPVGMRPGIDLADPDNMLAVESPAKFTWGGEVGFGWMERARPIKSLR
jgi:hypothetical protein